jgi:hypothetical protein
LFKAQTQESTVQWAAAPSIEHPTADALDATRRASDAKGPMRGDE